MKISCLILTWNEEHYIAQCVEYHKPYVDEVLVLDAHSFDRTRELAEAHGAKVVLDPNVDDMGASINFGMAQASNDWILQVDADELFDKSLLKEIKQLIERSDVHAFNINRTNLDDAAPIKTDDYQPRLYDRRFCEAQGIVHSQIVIRGGKQKMNFEPRPILHLPKTPEDRYTRRTRWVKLAEKQAA